MRISFNSKKIENLCSLPEENSEVKISFSKEIFYAEFEDQYFLPEICVFMALNFCRHSFTVIFFAQASKISGF
jgi:hypothetical protein